MLAVFSQIAYKYDGKKYSGPCFLISFFKPPPTSMESVCHTIAQATLNSSNISASAFQVPPWPIFLPFYVCIGEYPFCIGEYLLYRVMGLIKPIQVSCTLTMNICPPPILTRIFSILVNTKILNFNYYCDFYKLITPEKSFYGFSLRLEEN